MSIIIKNRQLKAQPKLGEILNFFRGKDKEYILGKIMYMFKGVQPGYVPEDGKFVKLLTSFHRIRKSSIL